MNPHAPKGTSPSSWRVCLFRHSDADTTLAAELLVEDSYVVAVVGTFDHTGSWSTNPATVKLVETVVREDDQIVSDGAVNSGRTQKSVMIA